MPATAVPVTVSFNVKFTLVTVKGSIPSLNVAPTLVLMATLVAPLAWMVPVTVGAVVSGAAAVVQLHV